MRVRDGMAVPAACESLKLAYPDKGAEFTGTRGDEYNLRGLLPARASSQETQESCALESLRRKPCDI